MRRAARKDDNHESIAEVFRSLDFSVLDISATPCGFDVVVGYKTQACLVEIKNPERPLSGQKLTPNEFSAHLNWRGPKAIVSTNTQAIALAHKMRSQHFAVMEGALADRLGS